MPLFEVLFINSRTIEDLEMTEPKETKLDGGGVAFTFAPTPSFEWPTPEEFKSNLPPVPAFNFGLIPSTLRPWLQDISERMQCPPDYPSVGAVVALGAVIGRKVGIRPKRLDDWLIVPNLWGMAVGRPGLMKTPAIEQSIAPLTELEKNAVSQFKSAESSHRAASMVAKERADIAKRKMALALKNGDENVARMQAEAAVFEAPEAPKQRRYKVNDPTIEKLAELLNENPNGLCLHRDELVGFLKSLDKEGREDSRAFFLETWNGTGDFTSDRIGRGTIRVEATTISILGAIQPGPLASYQRQALRSGTGDDGLLQRFQLAVWPDIPPKWVNVDRQPLVEAREEAFAAFRYLDELSASDVQAHCDGQIPFLRFAQDAQETFDQWRANLESRLRGDSEHPAFEAHLAKYRKLVPALALIFHLSNRKLGPVSHEALTQALGWAEYLEQHARRIYSPQSQCDLSSAKELAKHLKRGELDPQFSLRELYRKGWSELDTREHAANACEVLCEMGWLRQAEAILAETGRPPSPAFEINPKLKIQYS